MPSLLLTAFFCVCCCCLFSSSFLSFDLVLKIIVMEWSGRRTGHRQRSQWSGDHSRCMDWRTATGVLAGSKPSSSVRLATRTKRLYGSLLMRVGTIWAEVEPGVKPGGDKQVSVCLSLMVVLELAGMWQRDVVRATPLVVVRCCNRTSRTTAWRHEGTSLAEAGSGWKHERRTFIPSKTGSRLLRCCMLSSVGSLTTWTGTSGHLFPKMSMSTSRMPECGTSAPLTDCSVRKACCSERSCRWAAAHVSVTVATSLPALQPHVHSRGSWSLGACRSFPSCS